MSEENMNSFDTEGQSVNENSINPVENQPNYENPVNSLENQPNYENPVNSFENQPNYENPVNSFENQPNYEYQPNYTNSGSQFSYSGNQPGYGSQSNYSNVASQPNQNYAAGQEYQKQTNYRNVGSQSSPDESWKQQYINPQSEEKTSGNGFGIAALVLGIISLVLFCTCINLPMAVLAIIFAIVQLVRGGSKPMAITGLVTGIASIVCCIVFWILVSLGCIDEYKYYYNYPYGMEYHMDEDYNYYDYSYDYVFDDQLNEYNGELI